MAFSTRTTQDLGQSNGIIKSSARTHIPFATWWSKPSPAQEVAFPFGREAPDIKCMK